jgi:hypothetical protein
MKHTFLFSLLICLIFPLSIMAQELDTTFIQIDLQTGQLSLTQKGASHFAQRALSCIQVEYPNKLSHVMRDASQAGTPSELHPAFYGCFDWHSSVHGHWMLIRLLKLYPEMKEGPEIRKRLSQTLTKSNLLHEAAYLYEVGRKAFERTYGWAWMMKLSEELETWNDDQGQEWSENLQPVTDAIKYLYLDFFPKQDYPIREGTHTNTAFGMSFAYDYARAIEDEEISLLMAERAFDYYLTDANCPAAWEPGGADFLSPCLEEANLMSRFMPPATFSEWLEGLIPELKEGGPGSLMVPAEVSDRRDPQIVHLDGLNLSRAWCMYRIASALPEGDKRIKWLRDAAYEHIMMTLPYVASGNYEGEHWLASFAVYALSYGKQ